MAWNCKLMEYLNSSCKPDHGGRHGDQEPNKAMFIFIGRIETVLRLIPMGSMLKRQFKKQDVPNHGQY